MSGRPEALLIGGEADLEAVGALPSATDVAWTRSTPDGDAGAFARDFLKADAIVVASAPDGGAPERLALQRGLEAIGTPPVLDAGTPALVETILGSAAEARPASSPQPADQFETRLLWLSRKPLVSGRRYGFEAPGAAALATPEKPKYRLGVPGDQRLAAKTLRRGQVGDVNLALDREIAAAGRFVLTDLETGDIAGVGVLHFALRRSTNVRRQSLFVTPQSRAALKGHSPCVVWFTGLSGSGKSTLSNLVERALNGRGRHTVLLDGDNVRHGLNRDLGFTEADRAENIRRIAEVARLMADAGLIVLVSFISPFRAERRMARELIGGDRFLEVFVDAPLEVAESRDPKGLYRKARNGEILNFTGIDSPYEAPEAPDLHLETSAASPDDGAEAVLRLLELRRITD
jgi:bifunctional enzyme CysN/CysC